MSTRPLVIVAIGAFWPGNEASGPNRSFRAMKDALGHRFRFVLLARDRPFGAREAQAGAKGDPEAIYRPPGLRSQIGTVKLLRAQRPALLWLNGFFDRDFTMPLLAAKRAGFLGRTRVLLSPRGEFNPGALALKGRRKAAYVHGARLSRLLGNTTLHATTRQEAAAIAKALPWMAPPRVASNIVPLPDLAPAWAPRSAGEPLRLVFVGRIAPVKNLLFTLAVLAQCGVPVRFDLYGPLEDATHWEACRRAIAALPGPVAVHHHGPVDHAGANFALARADALFLPTLGENFGHAIFEALAAGTPVLISDRTPWRDLEHARAGWDLPLGDPAPFAEAIRQLADMDGAAQAGLRRGARALAERHVAQVDAAGQIEAMLDDLLDRAA